MIIVLNFLMGWVVQDLGLGDFDVIRASLIFANGNAFSRLNCSHNKFCLYSMLSALKFAKKLKFVGVWCSLNLQLIFPLCRALCPSTSLKKRGKICILWYKTFGFENTPLWKYNFQLTPENLFNECCWMPLVLSAMFYSTLLVPLLKFYV